MPPNIQKILKEFGHQDISLSSSKPKQQNFIQIKDEEETTTPLVDAHFLANLGISPVSITERVNFPSPSIRSGMGVSAQLWYQ